MNILKENKKKFILFIVIIFIFIGYSSDTLHRQLGNKTIITPQTTFFVYNLIIPMESYLHITDIHLQTTKLLDEKINYLNKYEPQEIKTDDEIITELRNEDNAQEIKTDDEIITELRNEAEKFEKLSMYNNAQEKYIEIIGIDKWNKKSYEKIIELYRLQDNQYGAKMWESIMNKVFEDKN